MAKFELTNQICKVALTFFLSNFFECNKILFYLKLSVFY